MSDQFVLRIFRGDQNGGEEREYYVPAIPGMVVLDAVHYVQAHDAPDLAVRWNCKAAHCGSCSAEINGMPKLMCKTRLDDYKGQVVHIQPMRTFPIIKDLVTDVSWNYEVAKKFPRFIPKPLHHFGCNNGMSTAFKNFITVSNVSYAKMFAMFCAIIMPKTNILVHVSWSKWRNLKCIQRIGRTGYRNLKMRPGSVCAT